MPTSARFLGRVATTGIALALAWLVAGASVHPAMADEEYKSKFKAGCEDSGGSFVENADDGSYQCNHRSGEVTKCFSDTPPRPCIHTPS